MAMNTGLKKPKAVMAITCALVIAALALLAPHVAWAREIQFPNGSTATLHEDGTITGTCSTVVYFVPFSNDDVDHFDVFMPDGQILRGDCIDYGYPTPSDSTYSFTATPAGGGSYNVIVNSGYAEWVVHTDGSIEKGAPDRSQRVGHLTWTPHEEVNGALTLVKWSRHLNRNGAAGDGSLAGATFHVVNASGGPVTVNGVEYADGETVLTITTDASGTAATADKALPAGTYTVREVGTPEQGYLLDEESQAWSSTFTISENGQRIVLDNRDGGITDDEMRGNVELFKSDSDTGARSAQGDATLAGAEFEIVNRSANSVPSPQMGGEVEPGEVVCTIVTDASGHASTIAADVNGWSIPDDFDGKALVYGTYEIREACAPSYGYLVEEGWSETFSIRADGQVVTLSTHDPVMRGRLVVGKISRENGSYLEQGAASLEGWTFEIVNRSANPVIIDGAKIGVGEIVKTIETSCVDGVFIADTGEQCLPYGTYEVHELQTMRPEDNGHLFDGESSAWSKTFSIRDDGETVDLSNEVDACANQVVRGDLKLVKVKSPGMERLAGVPFRITSTTTGEWHIIVTDRNGQATTSSETNSHALNTNGNDAALGEDGKVDESKLDDEAGVWFDGRIDVPTTPDDAKGALPFDTYTIEELPVAANEGLDLVTVEISVYRDDVCVDVGTLDDTAGAVPRIATTLTDPDGNKVIPASPDTLLIDTVAYNNLDTSKGYTLYGELWLVEDGRAVKLLASATAPFTPNLAHGTAEMQFGFDATALEGRSVVCFERLLDADGNELASHADASDEGQTVSIPIIGTTLVDAATKDHVASQTETGSFELVDTVDFAGLAPNRTYTLTGTLYDKATGAPLVRANGAPISASRTFTPRTSEGSVDVAFSFELPDAAGRQIVAFESLTCRGAEYAVHADIEDIGQTVSVPSIATTLTDAESGTHTAQAIQTFSLVDTVAFDGLVPGRTYTVTGTLHDRSTGEEVCGDDGAIVTGAATFTPEQPSSTVDVPFTFEADLGGRTIVAFETLESDGRTYATHADLTDEGQTVYVPTIETTLLDMKSRTHTAAHDSPCKLSDTITFSGLEPGKTYTAVGTLYARETGKPLMGKASESADERELTSTTTFTPDEASGTVEVVFDFDIDLAGKTVVAFEQVLDGDRAIAAHEDIDDENQSVRFNTPPAPPEPERPTTRPVSSAMAKTGDMLGLLLLAIIPAGVIGLALAAYSVRRLQREAQVTIERGKHRTQ